MIDSRCMADCYPPVTVGEGGFWLLSLPRGMLLSILSSIIYSIISFIILSHSSPYLNYHLKLLFERCLKYIHSNT